MFIGVDVGGTFTDGVLIDGKKVRKKIKVPTLKGKLISSLLETLDYIIEDIDPKDIQNIVFSTTLITNMVVENNLKPAALILIPGPGVNPNSFDFHAYTEVISGAIDFKGREIEPLDIKEIEETLQRLADQGLSRVAIVGKFAQRNNSHELKIKKLISKLYPNWDVEVSHEINGELNFPRRIATTLLTLLTKDCYHQFAKDVQSALLNRNITAPVFVLKADGGTLSLKQGKTSAVETIYSGPAASLLGVLGLTQEDSAIVLDIGGTTTDIGVIINREPLKSAKGIAIKEYLTQVRSFNVKAIPIGGDSQVEIIDGNLRVGPKRLGPAYCLGGPAVTPTDALSYLGLMKIGDPVKAEDGLSLLAAKHQILPRVLAQNILSKVSEIIFYEIEKIKNNWELEPAYRIWELKRDKTLSKTIVGIGGGAKGIVEFMARQWGFKAVLPRHYDIANAIGAAIACPTSAVTLRIDTEQGIYTFLEKGHQDMLPFRRFNDNNALDLARSLLQMEQRAKGIKDSTQYEVIRQEVFNIIRNSTLAGKIIYLKIQTPWRISFNLEGAD